MSSLVHPVSLLSTISTFSPFHLGREQTICLAYWSWYFHTSEHNTTYSSSRFSPPSFLLHQCIGYHKNYCNITKTNQKSTSTWPVQMINVVLFFLRQTTHSTSLSGRTFLYDSPVFARNFISIDSRTGSVIHTFGAVAPRSQSLSLLGCYVTHPRT